jgi:hypothetical protein
MRDEETTLSWWLHAADLSAYSLVEAPFCTGNGEFSLANDKNAGAEAGKSLF